MQTTYTRSELRRFELQIHGGFEQAIWQFLHTNFAPECEALQIPVGHLKHHLLTSNNGAVINAVCHAAEVVAAALDSPEMREEMQQLKRALAGNFGLVEASAPA